MKAFRMLFFALTLTLTSATLYSCGSKAATNQQGKEYTSAYICPMHCEGSGSEEAGKCPVCGMDYVKNDDHNHDGHDH